MEGRLHSSRSSAHQRNNAAATARLQRWPSSEESVEALSDLSSARQDSLGHTVNEEEVFARVSMEPPSYPSRLAQHVMTLIREHECHWQQAESMLLEGSENEDAYRRFGSKFFTASSRGRKRAAADDIDTPPSRRKVNRNTGDYGKTQWAFLLDLQRIARPLGITAYIASQGTEPLTFLEGSIDMTTISQMQKRPLEQQSVKYIINALVTCNMLLGKRSELDHIRQCFISLALYDMLTILKPGATTRQLDDELLETALRFIDEGCNYDLEGVKSAIKRGEKLHFICNELGEGAMMVLCAHMSNFSLLKSTPVCMRGGKKSPHFHAAMHHMADLGVQELVTADIRALAEGLRALLVSNFRVAYDRELKTVQAQRSRCDGLEHGKTRGFLSWIGLA